MPFGIFKLTLYAEVNQAKLVFYKKEYCIGGKSNPLECFMTGIELENSPDFWVG